MGEPAFRTLHDVAAWIRTQPDYVLANETTVPYETIYNLIERLLEHPDDATLTLCEAATLLEVAHRVMHA